jgi:uncharacterized protein
MTQFSREFQIFVKPVGPQCNLQCGYCYYLEKKKLFPESPSFRMTDDLLEKYILQHIEATTEEMVFFSWHGGEPLLAGIDFYRKAVAFQKKHLPAGQTILNGIQTNGTLLNEDWCRFLAENNFMVGISLDGTEELHDHHRRNNSGAGSFVQVIKGHELLRKYGINPEILCVVGAHNVKYPLEVYHFFKQLEAEFITFLPLVIRRKDLPKGVSPESVPPEEWGRFLNTIFDEWAHEDIEKVQIQIFEEAIQTVFKPEHTLCIFKVNCGGVPVVEHNGDFYACDHFVSEEYFRGNIRDHSLTFYLDSPEQKAFGEAKSVFLPKYCRECPVLALCNGECPKNRFISTPDSEPGLNYLCAGYRMFFLHCQPYVEAVRKLLVMSGQ